DRATLRDIRHNAQLDDRIKRETMGLRTIGALAMAAVLAGLTGCATNAWSNKQATGLNAFLNRIAVECAPLQMGRYQMAGMILRNEVGDTDAYNYFFDQTSRLYFG